MITRKPLYLLKTGERFSYKGENYTVFQHDNNNNMTEVFKNNRFWCWPNYNGKSVVMVDCVTQ